MATAQEKLASSLEKLKIVQDGGRVCAQSSDFSRTDRERLTKNGFLVEIIKGWYLITDPFAAVGDTTSWYSSYWGFTKEYLNSRFAENWCLTAEQSLLFHCGKYTVPRQLMIRSPNGKNNKLELLEDCSIFDLKSELPNNYDCKIINGHNVYDIIPALIAVSDNFFINNPIEARAILAAQRSPVPLLERLLQGDHTIIAGRLAGAFRNIGRGDFADEIMATMKAAGHEIRERDPFAQKYDGVEFARTQSPYVHRIRLMWQVMRADIIKNLPMLQIITVKSENYLNAVDDIYVTDAYHSLSIEGYRVTAELIERVRTGDWNPDKNIEDRQSRDALAARGYYQCFNAVKQSVARVLNGENVGIVASQDHRQWYRELFAPSVIAGLINNASLAGYRNNAVYIRGSLHVPLNHEAIPDAIEAFFELLQNEKEPLVRIILGHFIFVFIHPYSDGNGRMGRFLMNLMIASTGHDWTVIKLEQRREYMAALEIASVEQNIQPFAEFISKAING
jgi:fido (protein-threonine AMPylation protein)